MPTCVVNIIVLSRVKYAFADRSLDEIKVFYAFKLTDAQLQSV